MFTMTTKQQIIVEKLGEKLSNEEKDAIEAMHYSNVLTLFETILHHRAHNIPITKADLHPHNDAINTAILDIIAKYDK